MDNFTKLGELQGVTMNIRELLEAAKTRKGSYGVIAELLGMHQNRISEWKKGTRKPDASEIMRLAELADLEPIGTLLEVEAGLDDRFGNIWQRVANEWRARRDSNPRPLPSEGPKRKN